ncbi:hypothetical protein [Hymenobacter convexus]|uniref:hypothetical protein n=1 Tax=Hymenobacter sp. CA1UV-4 TaxID=3063782 RepID=UPI002713F5D7|nr:hypothetical protein [Hymenobacter sp. CA1UV-4]MDO7854703.1 hypothetical protein [Hymenobacter sp. CA1UV-4]
MAPAFSKKIPLAALAALMLAACLSFWLAPAPQGAPEVEYWGHYARVGPGLGFVVNHDSYGYLAVAQAPGKLLLPQEVRQSRPLYALLGTAVGYPLTALLGLAGRAGLTPPWPAEEVAFYGFYSGFVLLNGLVLLLALWLLRQLFDVFTAGQGSRSELYALTWVLVANPITKAFFWTAHQQMFAFLVPLFCLTLAIRLRLRPTLSWVGLGGLALGLGVLPLVYGSFVLAWPALAFGILRIGSDQEPGITAGWPAKLGKTAFSAALFGLPTLAWIILLELVGTTYYNHEAERFHQLVWLLEARHLPLSEALGLVGGKLLEYLASIQLMGLWLLAGAGLYAATRWRIRAQPAAALLPPIAGPALAWVAASFVLFFALLGYYPERLAFTLLPLVLCLLAALSPRWPRRYAGPAALAVAAGWHLYVLLSYGPFS